MAQLLFDNLEISQFRTFSDLSDIPGGAPEKTVQDVTENCRTLKFESYGFEEE